nr:MAG TPA: Putative tail fiber protein fold, Tail fiber, receptor [Caudoviricetes sp.]
MPLLFVIRQWGTSVHGWVSFPIIFNLHRVIITNHQGTAYYNSKPRESDTLAGFMLDVGENNDVSMDAYWIAIGL